MKVSTRRLFSDSRSMQAKRLLRETVACDMQLAVRPAAAAGQPFPTLQVVNKPLPSVSITTAPRGATAAAVPSYPVSQRVLMQQNALSSICATTRDRCPVSLIIISSAIDRRHSVLGRALFASLRDSGWMNVSGCGRRGDVLLQGQRVMTANGMRQGAAAAGVPAGGTVQQQNGTAARYINVPGAQVLPRYASVILLISLSILDSRGH